jgi:hypothetical protein
MALKKLFLNSGNLKTYGPNQSFGNHLSHLLFCYNFSKKRNFDLKISTESNLDKVFELEKFKSDNEINLINYFSESFSSDINELEKLDKLNLKKCLEILNDENLNIPSNIYFSGWFYNVPLYPNSCFFDEIKIKSFIIDYIELNFKKVLDQDSISIHYRGTDFNGHLGYDLRLPFDYYQSCIQHMMIHHKNIKNIFIFSEDTKKGLELVSFIKEINNSFNIEFIQNEYYIDWTCLHLSKNIISSNSSFCLTACINKDIIYQPKKYQLRNTPLDITYPSQPFFNNSYIL